MPERICRLVRGTHEYWEHAVSTLFMTGGVSVIHMQEREQRFMDSVRYACLHLSDASVSMVL